MINSLFTSHSGMNVNRKALDVSSENISNANTKGYSKQKVNLEEVNYLNNNIGSGVKIENIEREHDIYFFEKLKDSNTKFNEYSSQSNYINSLNNNFDSEKMLESLNTFFESIKDFELDPNNTPFNTDNIDRSFSNMKEHFNIIDRNMKDTIKNIDKEIESYEKELENLKDIKYDLKEKISEFPNNNKLKDDLDKIELNISKIGDENNGILKGLNNISTFIENKNEEFNNLLNDVETNYNDFRTDSYQNIDSYFSHTQKENFKENLKNIDVEIKSTEEQIFRNIEQNETMLNNYQQINDDLKKVDIDEEMINLLTYQKGYEANAKVIQVVNEMLQTLLNIR